MSRILIAEDHRAIAKGLSDNLEAEGHEVRIAGDGLTAIDVALQWAPDVILLDLMLPKRDGFDVLSVIRLRGQTMPVLVVSARGSEADKVRALTAGADDYVVKPFGLLEILARVHALIRRSSGRPLGAPAPECYDLAEVRVDVAKRRVLRRGVLISLRPREFDLLVALCRARGAVASRSELLNRVWGYDRGVVTRTVDTHIAALRQRLERDPENPQLIVTVRKAGYRAVFDEGSVDKPGSTVKDT